MRFRESFYLHAYARGVDKRTTFIDAIDSTKFFLALTLSLRPRSPSMSALIKMIDNKLMQAKHFTLSKVNKMYGKPIVDILSAVLMPNHFHLQIKFHKRSHITQLFKRLINSYTKYFNTRHQREGRLFSSSIKKAGIVTDEQNIYLTKYIHTNPLNSSRLNYSTKTLDKYPWSTLSQYLNKPQKFSFCKTFTFNTTYFCNPKDIVSQFSSPQSYRKFVFSEAEMENKVLSQKELIDQSG